MSVQRTLAAALGSCVLVLAGCSADTAGTAPEPDGVTASAPSAADRLLSEHGLAGLDAVQVVDRLDRLALDERPDALMASVRPAELVVSQDGEEASLPVPDGQFYLSVAPYVDGTHECFHHSLTTCRGELSGEQVEVEIVDEDGTVLVEGTRTTFDNGFVGFWLPRDIEATITVRYDGRTAEAPIATGPDSPTCLTTLQLV